MKEELDKLDKLRMDLVKHALVNGDVIAGQVAVDMRAILKELEKYTFKLEQNDK